jgi:cell division septation protein DedD
MARDSRNLSDSFEGENTGGFTSGFLAEEDELDRRALWRLGSWAVATVGAVVVAMLASQSSIGMRREQLASADLVRQSQQIQTVAKESQSEARRLASAIETLNSDRDRLYSRVAVLEQGLDSVTGGIARQDSAVKPQPTVSSETPATVQRSPPATALSPVVTPQAAAPAETPAMAQKPSPAPAVSPMGPATAATAPAITRQNSTVTSPQAPAPPEMPAAAQKSSPGPAASAVGTTTTATTPPAAEKPPTIAAPAEPVPVQAPSGAQAAPIAPAVTLPPPLVAAKSMMGPPDPAAGKLIEPSPPPKTVTVESIPELVVASSSPADEAAESDSASAAPKLAVQRTEFGIDVGGANSLPGLRALWRGLLKSRSNAALATLRPIIVIKESNNGLGMQLRLVAGPINDAAAAAKICAGMIENERSCATTVFEGQRLSMNANEPAAADAKPAPAANPPLRKRYTPKRAAKDEPAQKPESSTLSSLFSRR